MLLPPQQGGGYVIVLSFRMTYNVSRGMLNSTIPYHTICRSVCHSINRITGKCGNGCRPNLAGMGKGWPSGSDLLLVVIRIHMWIPDHSQLPICTILGKMTDADWMMHPQRFGTDPTDIQIRINPKVRIWIPDHFQLKFLHWQRFALSECSCWCSVLLLVYHSDIKFRTT